MRFLNERALKKNDQIERGFKVRISVCKTGNELVTRLLERKFATQEHYIKLVATYFRSIIYATQLAKKSVKRSKNAINENTELPNCALDLTRKCYLK